MATGENEQALQKIIELLRLLSIVVLLIHFYLFLHDDLFLLPLTHPLLDQIVKPIREIWAFHSPLNSKVFSAGLLVISLLGANGRKDETISPTTSILCMAAGLLTFFASHLHTSLSPDIRLMSGNYVFLTSASFIMTLTGGIHLSRTFPTLLSRKDIFNKLNESFPQEERLLENEYSINLPAQYCYRGQVKKSWINIINPFRGLIVLGTPGAGKSYFVIRHVIIQHIRKGFPMFVYDFKLYDLTRIAYNALLQYHKNYTVVPKFFLINFDDLSRTHCCNPLDPATMLDITDATESSRTIMLGLNRDWIKKQGDFFVESPINFVTAIIWFLRKHDDGKYCTLPHVIELMQLDYPTLFKLLRTEPEIEVLINPFESAFRNEAMEQLEGQIASAKIGLARLSSPPAYYVLRKSEFTLDINNPLEPKIVCMGNNPQKQQIYGAILSLYISRLIKQINRKGQLKCSIVGDEFPTAYWGNIDTLLATARSNKVATCLALQDYSQLKKDYGRDQAEVILNIVGNIISGQVVGETAKQLSDRFGKIVQQRDSLSINSSDTSVSQSSQLDSAIPPSKIAGLSSGEFVGMVADDPLQKIELKTFHAEILNDHEGIRKEEKLYKEIPVIRNVTPFEIQENYFKIKKDIERIVSEKIEQQPL
jgi:hypothetical protein